jgi:hypothetical protein
MAYAGGHAKAQPPTNVFDCDSSFPPGVSQAAGHFLLQLPSYSSIPLSVTPYIRLVSTAAAPFSPVGCRCLDHARLPSSCCLSRRNLAPIQHQGQPPY